MMTVKTNVQTSERHQWRRNKKQVDTADLSENFLTDYNNVATVTLRFITVIL